MINWQQKIEQLRRQKLSLLVEKDERILCQSSEPRLSPLFHCVRQHREEMRGATVIDKIVGKAAAYLCALVGVRAVYTPLASQSAREVLLAHGIELQAQRLVPMIQNQERTGPCPMEQLADTCQTPEEFFDKLGERITD